MISLRLKAKIVERFGAQWLFAKALGVCDARVSDVLHGKRVLSESEKRHWATVLGCEIEELFPISEYQK